MSSAVDELQNFECVNIDLQKHSKCSNAQVAKAVVVVKHEKSKMFQGGENEVHLACGRQKKFQTKILF